MMNQPIVMEQATLADTAAIKALWATVFEDSPEEIESFLSHFLGIDHAFVIRNGGDIVSMLFLIEAALVFDGQTVPVGYIYAGMTRPQFRGKGLYRQLLQAAEAFAVENGLQAIFLQPADEVLAKTYEHMGFTVPLYADFAKGTAAHESSLRPLTAEAYGRERHERLIKRNQPFIEWPLRVYRHVSLWGQGFEMLSGALLLQTIDSNVTADTAGYETVLERVGAVVEKQIPMGRLKWLTPSRTTNEIYMGYGMD